MKVTIIEDEGLQDVEVSIRCPAIDEQVAGIVTRLRLRNSKITGVDENGRTRVAVAAEVLYVESVDKKTFAYMEQGVLDVGMPLYEVEERLRACDFLRVSRSCVVNFGCIKALRPDINGRLLATLENGEDVVISRQYASDIKHKLGLR